MITVDVSAGSVMRLARAMSHQNLIINPEQTESAFIFPSAASNPSYARLTSESREENRHKPVFPECTAYDQIHVKENMTAGSPVVLVLAKDGDVGKNGIVSYSLINDFGSFAIHSSSQQGQVTTTRRLDRDKGDKDFLLTVIARDGAVEALQDSCSFKVIVEDINDNAPVFDQLRYDQTLAADHRSGTTVLRVTASDLDAGENAHVTYSLKARHPHDLDYFAIDSSSGIMSLRRPLDDTMANSKTFELSVQAEDQGRPALSSTVPITITVVSSGELPPTIVSQNPLHPIIPENTTENTPVVTVCARSNLADSPNVYFTLINGNTRDTNSDGTFALRRLPDSSSACVDSSGVSIFVATRNLDYESVESYNLLLQVVNDQNARVDKRIPVSIADVNDNAPLLQPFDGAVVENADGALITTIVAVDLDASPEFRELTYAFDALATEDVRTKFELKPNGELWTTRPLDREEVKQYRVPIQVTDGVPALALKRLVYFVLIEGNDQNARVDKQLLVDIVDVNDNAPLLQLFDGSLVENAERALITTIKAVDKDTSPQFRQLIYKFDATATEDVRTKFELKPNGELWTTRPLDREEVKQYRVPIQVTDGVPEHERMTTYWITVQDLNDVAPVFAPAGVFEVELPENRELGKPTGIRLPVLDPDIVNNITYEIVEGNEDQKFRIDSTTGDVLVNKLLDFDHPVMDRNFTMRVRVNDGANAPAETEITIAVTNVNDLQPVFERANYTFTVTENTDCDVTFGKVSAIDPDLPHRANQNILYYLSPDELRNFTIGATTGNLTIKGCLDREAATRGTMTLYPRANDEGGRGHDADPATVQMIILDLNDNHPYIKKPERSYAMIRENLDPKRVEPIIIQLDDLDSPENGCPCTLEFWENTLRSFKDKFSLTQLAGSEYELRPTTTLDREEQKVYKLPFLTRDSQGVSGMRFLTLEVGDENDSPMTDGTSNIKVYNYQGQFSSMVIGAVHVTDLDDYDLEDKTFEVDPMTSSDVATHFRVNHETGNITMLKGTPSGQHVLRVKVHDNFRGERAVGEVVINVVDLTLDAVMQSGSLRIANMTANQMLQHKTTTGVSLYERLKEEIARLHSIREEQVDIFTLRDVSGGVDVRYNCHSSPYYTAARLDAVLLQRRRKVEESLGVEIPMIDINLCLYEGLSPCGDRSCQHTMRPNLTSPLVVASETSTMVGVDITDDYTCDCGALEPLPSVCFEGFCYNGGTCHVVNRTLTCACLDDSNYGPRCELMTARFERGFAWYEPPNVCENSSFSMVFETNDASGVLFYTGPIVTSPWPDYPRDFLYVILNNWVLEVYLDLGSGTLNMSIPIEENTARSFEFVLSWDKIEITLEVLDCGINGTLEVSDPCRKSLFLPGPYRSTRHLLNVQGPMQVGGTVAMTSFAKLSSSFGWTLTPPSVYPFSGCVLELRHNDHLYDLNATDYSKKTYQPCDAPRTSRVVLGQQSVIIILASLLCLLLLVLVILCLARRGRKTISYPDLDREIVKETLGGTDIEGFGEKDVTNFDFKFLQVTPDGYLINDDDDGRIPDVALDASQRQTIAPLAKMPEGLSIGDFINDNIKKVDEEHQDVDDVRHYNAQGDEMSAASLSSLASGLPSTAGTSSAGTFDYRSDWGQRFEKLAAIYGQGAAGQGEEEEEEEDSEFEFPDIPDPPRNYSLRASFAASEKSSSSSPASVLEKNVGVLVADSNSNSNSNSNSTSLSNSNSVAAPLANHYPPTREPKTAKEEIRDHNGADGRATDVRAADAKAAASGAAGAAAGADPKAKKDAERPALRTNKEPVTKKIEYHEAVNPMVSAVNGVSVFKDSQSRQPGTGTEVML
ncbi:neural-cadherin-like [Penaeus japonicus]|uniref:neural-cadherin-like n=1 Tax=Penaeus japonicus TaxID=27405 RepID=UPI001C70FBD8|nr:neural-cadherin-like [Penaeus japonicus]